MKLTTRLGPNDRLVSNFNDIQKFIEDVGTIHVISLTHNGTGGREKPIVATSDPDRVKVLLETLHALSSSKLSSEGYRFHLYTMSTNGVH